MSQDARQGYDQLSDDHYINLHLNTEMELPSTRESVLHFFEQIQKKYPAMRNFYTRDRHEFVLEEEKESGSYRWVTLEPRRILSGYVNPPSEVAALTQHAFVLELAPYALSIGGLDCEFLSLMYGFDFTYRGNHNQLVAEALGVPSAYERLYEVPGTTVIGYEPAIQFTWQENCRLQGRLGVENRTSAYHIRTGEYPEEQFTIYLMGRRYGCLEPGETFVSTLRQLTEFSHHLLDEHVIEHVLKPVRQTIAIK